MKKFNPVGIKQSITKKKRHENKVKTFVKMVFLKSNQTNTLTVRGTLRNHKSLRGKVVLLIFEARATNVYYIFHAFQKTKLVLGSNKTDT